MSDFRQYRASNQSWPEFQDFINHKIVKMTNNEAITNLQRNPSVGSALKIFIFQPYGFDYLGFLTNARRGAMRSKTQWVFYRDLD